MWSIELVVQPAGNGLKKLLFRLLYYIGDVGEVLSALVRGPTKVRGHYRRAGTYERRTRHTRRRVGGGGGGV